MDGGGVHHLGRGLRVPVGMTYSASLEQVARDPPTYVLRIHAAGGVFGDPYFGAATVTVENAVATVRGLAMHAAEYDREVKSAVARALGGIGCREMTWIRLVAGKTRRIVVPLPDDPAHAIGRDTRDKSIPRRLP